MHGARLPVHRPWPWGQPHVWRALHGKWGTSQGDCGVDTQVVGERAAAAGGLGVNLGKVGVKMQKGREHRKAKKDEHI